MPLHILVMMCALFGADAAPMTPTDTTVNRALGFLQQDMLRWKADRNCAACHHAPLMIWSFHEAQRAGYEINERYLEDVTQWTLTDPQARVFPDSAPPGEGPSKLALSTIYTALALNAAPATDTSRVSRNRIVEHLRETQNADGTWTGPAGRGPIFDRPRAVTALALLALPTSTGEASEDALIAGMRQRAESGLASTTGDDTHQEIALRLMVAAGDERRIAETATLVSQLRRLQQPDGSWRQTAGMEGDAYATGQSLYALRRAGVATNDPAVSRALAFLVRTQQPDGSWLMTSRPDRPEGRPARSLNPITYAGTAWATLGLVRASGAGSASADPR